MVIRDESNVDKKIDLVFLENLIFYLSKSRSFYTVS